MESGLIKIYEISIYLLETKPLLSWIVLKLVYMHLMILPLLSSCSVFNSVRNKCGARGVLNNHVTSLFVNKRDNLEWLKQPGMH